METVKRLAKAVKHGLRDAHPGLRKPVRRKLALAVLRADVRLGDRSLPLAWLAEAGAANVG